MTGFLIAVSLCVPGSTVDMSNPPPAYVQAATVDFPAMDGCFCDCRCCRDHRCGIGNCCRRDHQGGIGTRCYCCLCSVVDEPPRLLPRPPLRPQRELWRPMHDLMLPPPNSFLLPYPQLDPLLLLCQYDLLGGLDSFDSPIGLLPPDPRDPVFTPMEPELGLVNPVPEPSTLALLAVAAVIVVRRRK